MTPFTITEPRSHVMTFSTALLLIHHAVFIQNPVNSFHFYAYTSPLTNLTWLILLVWITATPPILFLVARLVVSWFCICAVFYISKLMWHKSTGMGNLMKKLMNSPSQGCLSWLVAHSPKEDLLMLHPHGKQG